MRNASLYVLRITHYALPSLGQHIQQEIQVGRAGAEVDDAGAQHQPPVQLRAGEKDLPFALGDVEQPPVERVQVVDAMWCVAKAGDAERTWCDELEVAAGTDFILERARQPDIAADQL